MRTVVNFEVKLTHLTTTIFLTEVIFLTANYCENCLCKIDLHYVGRSSHILCTFVYHVTSQKNDQNFSSLSLGEGRGAVACTLSSTALSTENASVILMVKVRETRWQVSQSTGSLTIKRLRTADQGSYRCIVNSLVYAPVMSSPAQLTVRSAFRSALWKYTFYWPF